MKLQQLGELTLGHAAGDHSGCENCDKGGCYGDRVAKAAVLHPCEYGHGDCSLTNRGKCSNEHSASCPNCRAEMEESNFRNEPGWDDDDPRSGPSADELAAVCKCGHSLGEHGGSGYDQDTESCEACDCTKFKAGKKESMKLGKLGESMNAVYKNRAYRVGDEIDGTGVDLEDVATGKTIHVDYGDLELLLDPTDDEYFACENAPADPTKA